VYGLMIVRRVLIMGDPVNFCSGQSHVAHPPAGLKPSATSTKPAYAG
jgi:hypothetical protein